MVWRWCVASFARVLMRLRYRYLLENMDWLEEELGGYDDDYLIFDCPGKISLCTPKYDPSD